jgi:hypothetical protein
MVLDYIPCDIDNFSYLYEDYKKLKDLDITEGNKLFYNLLDTRFCRHVLPRGKNKGKMCMKKIRNDGIIYCHIHKYLYKKCKINSCDNRRKKGYKICTKHCKYKTKINNEIILFNNIDLYMNSECYPNMDNFRCYYTHINIWNIKIRNDFTFPKIYFHHKSIENNYNNNPIIKYKRFSVINFFYKIYTKYKNLILDILQKYKINISFLYILLLCIKQFNEKNDNTIDIKKYISYMINVPLDHETIYDISYKNNYYYHFIPNKRRISEISKISYNPDDMKIVLYNNYFHESINEYINNRIKKNIKNRKKKLKQKLKNKIEDISIIPRKEYETFCIFINKFEDLSNEKKLKELVNYENHKDKDKLKIINILKDILKELEKIKTKYKCKNIIRNIEIMKIYCFYLLDVIIKNNYEN